MPGGQVPAPTREWPLTRVPAAQGGKRGGGRSDFLSRFLLIPLLSWPPSQREGASENRRASGCATGRAQRLCGGPGERPGLASSLQSCRGRAAKSAAGAAPAGLQARPQGLRISPGSGELMRASPPPPPEAGGCARRRFAAAGVRFHRQYCRAAAGHPPWWTAHTPQMAKLPWAMLWAQAMSATSDPLEKCRKLQMKVPHTGQYGRVRIAGAASGTPYVHTSLPALQNIAQPAHREVTPAVHLRNPRSPRRCPPQHHPHSRRRSPGLGPPPSAHQEHRPVSRGRGPGERGGAGVGRPARPDLGLRRRQPWQAPIKPGRAQRGLGWGGMHRACRCTGRKPGPAGPRAYAPRGGAPGPRRPSSAHTPSFAAV